MCGGGEVTAEVQLTGEEGRREGVVNACHVHTHPDQVVTSFLP